MSTRKNILSKRSNTSYSLRKGGFISFSKKKSISKYNKSLSKSLSKKYSSKKLSVPKLIDTRTFVNHRIESNAMLITQYQQQKKKESLKSKLFGMSINPQLMESILLLIKITCCGIILPLVVYMKDEEISSLVKTKDISNFFSTQLDNISKIIVDSANEHPVAVIYLCDKFIKILLGRFS